MKNEFGTKKLTKEEHEARKAAIIESQKKILDVIEAVSEYFDTALKNGEMKHFSMKYAIEHLEKVHDFTTEDTKPASQYNYLIMDLANARTNRFITDDGVNVRILYIEERLKTALKKELHKDAANIIKKFDTLYAWNNEATGENYGFFNETATKEE